MEPANRQVAVVIPVYKEVLSSFEKISLQQCIKKLHTYPIYIVKPGSLNTTAYREIYGGFIEVSFSDSYFASISGYNRLMLSPSFYRKFISYQYILVYQLDAFVFRNKINEWCNLNVDYLGAPWVGQSWVGPFRDSLTNSRFRLVRMARRLINFDKRQEPLVGNGGFSLRRVRNFFIISVLLKVFSFLVKSEWNEDVVWSLVVPKYFPWFKTGTFQQALGFCIESNPEKCLAVNAGDLPLGTHAWDKNVSFWANYIKKEGYTLDI